MREKPAERSAYRVWRSFSTRWADNDVYGHVNNIVFYQWFDSAVNGWMIDEGLLDPAKGDPIALVVETRCTYFAPLSFPALVEVGIAVARLGTSSVRYRIGIFAAGSADAAAQGEFVHVTVDRATRRPRSIPDLWRARMQAIAH